MASLLLVFVVALFLDCGRAEPTCSLDKHLNQCGLDGISQEQCERNGCCWNGEMPKGAPPCFHKNAGYEYFSITADRVECGYFGINEDECKQNGCHFAPKLMEPWCFYPNTNIDPALCLAERVECGSGEIGQDECEAKGCCWSPPEKGLNAPTCYFSWEATEESSEASVIAIAKSVEETETEASVEPWVMEMPYFHGEVHVLHGQEAFEIIEEEVEPMAPASTSAYDFEDIDDLDELFDESVESWKLGLDDKVGREIDEAQKATDGFASGWPFEGYLCKPGVKTNYDCVVMLACFWSDPENCCKCPPQMTDLGHRNLGKFWMPDAIY